jgi:predicted GH43/DUF377 family glycosyl hydrolase
MTLLSKSVACASLCLFPNSDEREGYVPNVLYSCGAIIHNEKLIIPYGVSDSSTAFAEVCLQELLDKLKNDQSE